MRTLDSLKISNKVEDFFHINLKIFQDRRIFPFQLYVFHPVTKQYTVFLHGNCPLIKDKWDLLEYIISRGGELAVRKDQQRTFLTSMTLREKDIPSLANGGQQTSDASALLKSQMRAKAALRTRDKFVFKDELQKSVIDNNFSNLIESARNEILAFPCTISHTVSLARHLAQELLYEDNLYNRVVALTYHLSLGMGIADEESLGALVCASFFYHIGNTQLDFATLKRPTLELVDEERKKYRQHPGLTLHLMKKFNLDLDPRCYQIMLDHHERTDGSGFPNFKRDNTIDPLGLALGAVSHILEFHYGHVTGNKTTLPNIFTNLKGRTYMAGLEIEFGALVYQNLVHLLNVEALKNLDQEKAA